MRFLFLPLGFLPVLAAAQNVTSVYNRDTHEPFRLKNVAVESTVIGPIVRTSTWLTYENPYQALTEASLNFDLPSMAALSGFAYRYGDEYVRGRLMDKAKAWFIYTAITSRNRDPGIMEQLSPSAYHCQIFPLMKGRDLKVRLWTVGLVGADGALPKPRVDEAEPDWKVRSIRSGAVRKAEGGYFAQVDAPVLAVAQRFKDGRVYVAGYVRRAVARRPEVEIVAAHYLPQNQGGLGADVTQKVAEIVARGETTIPAENRLYGDPYPNVLKRLYVVYRVDGKLCERNIVEHDRADLANDAPSTPAPTFRDLKQAKTIRLDDRTYAFCGWLPKNRTLSAVSGGSVVRFRPRAIPAGGDAAKLWAQQMLATQRWGSSREVLAFSLKYGVPSAATALLAVPKSEMARYREKEKEFQKREAEQRRSAEERRRQGRGWAPSSPQNWRSSGGGDPEIRVTIPNAVRVVAFLPDRRVLELKANGDVWGGNFEIPASAPEGTYRVRVLATLRDGKTEERTWTYEVDRTPPKGEVHYADGVVTVHSEPGLAEVAAYTPDGSVMILPEVSPGVYRGPAQKGTRIVLKDRAGNKG